MTQNGAHAAGPILIRGARLLDPARGIDEVQDVLLSQRGVLPAGSEASACTIDGDGLMLAPGLVDLHCHLREPGQEYKETVASGLRAAARGGFTTVCAMPNTLPPIDNRAVVERVLAAARESGLGRVLPIGCVTAGRAGERLAELGELAEAGCIGFSDDGSPVADATIMRRALEYAGGLGLPIIDHCEEPSLAKGGVMHEGWVSTRLGLRGQPAAAEEAMAARDIQLAELTGAHVHLAHVSAAGTVELLRAAKARCVRVTAEVTPHHLALTDEAILYGPPGALTPAYDTDGRVNPPLRSERDRVACLAALADGTIDCVATDHAPHALMDKQVEFDDAAPGISGLETALGVLLTLVADGALPLRRAIEALTIGPARALALDRVVPGLGTLAPGAPADAVLFAPDERWTVEPHAFASLGKNTPFRGRTLRGRVIATIHAGRLVYDGRGSDIAAAT